MPNFQIFSTFPDISPCCPQMSLRPIQEFTLLWNAQVWFWFWATMNTEGEMWSSKVVDLHSDPCHCTHLPKENKAQVSAGSTLCTSWHPLPFNVEKPSVFLVDTWNSRACHSNYYDVSSAFTWGASRQKSYHQVRPSNNSMINWKFYSDFWWSIHKSKTPYVLMEESTLGLWLSVALPRLSLKNSCPEHLEIHWSLEA